MLQGIMRRHSLEPRQIAMVGDRIYTDMAMARNAGAVGVLVLSGETTPEEAAEAADADIIVRDIRELGDLILEARSISAR